MSNMNGFALVDYDVHKGEMTGETKAQATKRVAATYQEIYKHIYPISVRFTESVYVFKVAYTNAMNIAFVAVNDALAKKGFPPVTFNVTPIAESADGLMNDRVKRSLNDEIRSLGQSLLKSIEALEGKFNEKTDDVESFLYKTRLKIAQAKRDLDVARGLVLMFAVEKDAKDAIDAVTTIIAAEAVKRQMAKEQNAADAKKAEAAGLQLVEELEA